MTHAPTDEEIKALVERLREGEFVYSIPSGDVYKGPSILDTEAAAALEAIAAQVAEMRAEIERCHIRLEIDHCFKLGDGDELVREEIPFPERASFPDGILARDETIKLVEHRAEAAEKRLAEVEAERDDILADSRLMTHHRKKQGDSDTKIIESLQAHRDRLVSALREIIARSHNDSLGTSKVIDMRKIADAALSGSDVAKTALRLNFFGQDGEFTFEWLGKNGPEAMISFEPDGTVGYALLDGDHYRAGEFSVWEQPDEAEKEIKEHLAKLDAVKTAREDGDA